MDDSSCDNQSFVSGLTMGSAAPLDSDDEDDDMDMSEDSRLFLPICFGSSSSSSDAQSNLRHVLEQVLNDLDDEFDGDW